MGSKELMLIGKKEALSIVPAIITRNDSCYYLSDDYFCFLRLNKNLPHNCEILNLAGIFQEALRNLRQPFLNLFAELSEKYDSLAWWGTHLASRSSAPIPLLRNIIYLYAANKILDGANSKRVIFIGESPALLDSIAKHALERGYHVVHRGREAKIIHNGKLCLAYGIRIIDFIWRNLKNRRAALSILKPMSNTPVSSTFCRKVYSAIEPSTRVQLNSSDPLKVCDSLPLPLLVCTISTPISSADNPPRSSNTFPV